MRPFRIVHVVSSLQVGGLEHFVIRMAAGQIAAGHHVSILALRSGGPLARTAAEHGVPIRQLTASGRLGRVLQAVVAFAATRPEIVHGHNATTIQYSLIARRCTRAKIVLTAHGRGKSDHRAPTSAEWRGLDAVAAVSEAVADEVRALVLPARLSVIRNGIEPGAPTKSRAEVRAELGMNDTPAAIIVARIDHLKGHRTLLEAWSRLPLPRPILLIVGDGAERGAMEALSADLQLQQCVRFLGFRSDVADLLAAVDLFLLPSLTEGLPLSILEAMSHGLPIVATRVGGIPELVTDGVHGALVPPEDAAPLAAAVARLMADSALRTACGEAGRQHVAANFSFAQMLNRYNALYESL